MRRFTKRNFEALLEKEDGVCVSIMLPMEMAGQATRKNSIRFKNSLQKARESLVELGWKEHDAERLLEPVVGLVDDRQFWQHQKLGLAVFVSPHGFEYYSVSISLPSIVYVGRSFYLKPLIPLISLNERFYVLALSQNSNRILRCTRDSFVELHPEGVPKSLDDALRYDDPEEQIQAHSAEGNVVFHGHGLDKDDSNENLIRYFRQIDEGLHDLLNGEQAPMVVMCVDYLFPLYEKVDTYSNLVSTPIEGNPEELHPHELHDRGWNVIKLLLRQEIDRIVNRYKNLAGTGLAAGDVREIVPAAVNGRIDKLIVPANEQQWGIFEKRMNKAKLSEDSGIKGEDLLNLAAVETFAKGGEVYVLDEDEMPSREDAIALFRY